MAASRLIRFFSRRKTKHYSRDATYPSIKNGLICTVICLDGETLHFEVDRKALGKTLYEQANKHFKLREIDYFALQFTDTFNIKQWLDPTKSIKKQCQIGPPYTFRFRVKFYASDPQNLHEELTRYLFVLQLREDIRTGKLDCPLDTSVDLAALAIQAELGDFTKDEHSIDTISDFHFLRDELQTERFEQQVLDQWMTYKGLTPADCEIQYLNKARWLEMYGVDLHHVRGKDGLDYKLGLTPSGILVFENQIKIGLFVWSKIVRLDFRRNRLTIIVIEDDDHNPNIQRDFIFSFSCSNEKHCKYVWKCAMEYHVFYRTNSSNKIKQQNLTRLGSRFRFSGRTEYQTVVLDKMLDNSNRNFQRKASQRFSRRASYMIRKKLQEQEQQRQQDEERLKKLKFEQENRYLSEPTKHLSLQRTLPATQRLDNLIQGKADEILVEKSIVPNKQSNTDISCLNEKKIKEITNESTKSNSRYILAQPTKETSRHSFLTTEL